MNTRNPINLSGGPKKPRFGPRMLRESVQARQLAILLLRDGFDFKAVSTALNVEFGIDEGEDQIQIDRQVFQALANKGRSIVGGKATPGNSCLAQILREFGDMGDVDREVEKLFSKYQELGKYFAQPESIDSQNNKWLSNKNARLAVAFLWQETKVRYLPSIQNMLSEMYGIRGVGVNALREFFYEEKGLEKKESLFAELKDSNDRDMMSSIQSAVSTWYKKNEGAKEQAKKAAQSRWKEAQVNLKIVGMPVYPYVDGTSKSWYTNPQSLALVILMLSKRVKGKRIKEGQAPNIANAVLHFYGFPIDEESIKNQIRRFKNKKGENKTDAELFIEAMIQNVSEDDMEQAEQDFMLWQSKTDEE